MQEMISFVVMGKTVGGEPLWGKERNLNSITHANFEKPVRYLSRATK